MKDEKKYDDKKVFKVPENYFEDFTQDMMQKINQSQDKGARKIFALIRPHLMLAASMVFIVVASYTALKLLLPEYSVKDQTENSGELIEYLAYELDQSSLLESFDMSENEIISDYTPSEDLTDDEIVDYLVSIDFSLIDLNNN